MPRILTSIFALIVLLATVPAIDTAAQDHDVTCDDFDAWQWAQTVLESGPDNGSSLDPDGDGIACPSLPRDGFAPVLWTDSIPASAVPAHISTVTDGDTFDVMVDGVPATIRMYHINTPELGGENQAMQCGAEEATSYLSFILSLVPGETVYLEYDETQRDRYDRRLAYVWFELAGEVYMVNEVMVRNGWAESETYEPDVKYRDQLDDAEQFSIRHQLGVRGLCGTLGVELEPEPQVQAPSQANPSDPNGIAAPPGGKGTTTGCEPAYPGVCIPIRSDTGDLDCGDVSVRRFEVVPPDPHNFDGDQDGIGCESG